jgi:hypothetical protein
VPPRHPHRRQAPQVELGRPLVVHQVIDAIGRFVGGKNRDPVQILQRTFLPSR